MKTDALRKKFLDFFKSKKHKVVESDSLVPKDDPTVLFTPAGMNQFKKQFLGEISDFTRAATSQRCLRTDDLGKVGTTTGHHTFFEMLGNFSFGDYFKKEAIAWAWEFLTRELKINEDKLWVSVYKDDDEAYGIWRDTVKVPAHKIVKLGDKENFWPSEAKEKGPNGPCGPCSEIFFDFGKDKGCGKPDCSPACDCGRFVEIWNLVFTQFNRKEGGILEPLPQKNIDTGMGLERLAAVMQGAPNNFETDLFQPLLEEVRANVGLSPNNKIVYAIADHLRAITFSIYDGVLPSNEGRGYVVRKLIRKSALHLKSLRIDKPFLYKLVPVLAGVMEEPYPELAKRREDIAQVILAEEKNFNVTLNASAKIMKERFAPLFKKPDPELAGRIVFQLYDTYGIPFELSKDWLKIQGLQFSQSAFDSDLETQKMRSKGKSAMKGDVFSLTGPALTLPATKFSGYKRCEEKAKLLAIVKEGGDETVIVLDKTPFYAESGGQVGDVGVITKGKKTFEVTHTKKSGKVILHVGRFKYGSLKKSDTVTVKVDMEARLATARNHTATHLLQAALRKVLGAHVKQQGSLVASDKLRFDFTHFKDVTDEELVRTEELVNNYIMDNHLLVAKEMPIASARRTGALAFFGEKYESKVRVVSIGDFSKEFCGGTHLEYTGQIGYFKITHESSVASGVRRIEAVTGKGAFKAIKQEEAVMASVSALLNVPQQKMPQEIEKRLGRLKELEKQLSATKVDTLKTSIEGLIQRAQVVGNKVNLITDIMEGADMAVLRNAVDLIKQKASACVIALGSRQQGKAMLVIGLTQDLAQKGIDASSLIVDVAKIIGGSGGGRKDFAQAGGSLPENLEKAFEELKKIVAGAL